MHELGKGRYVQTLSREYPGLFVILLDQSESMNQKMGETNVSKADIVTSHVNSIIKAMIGYAQIDELSGRRKNYAYVSILGYNDSVYPLHAEDMTPISLPDLDESAKGVMNEQNIFVPKISGDAIQRFTRKATVWIVPKAKGETNMTLAFAEAEKVIRNWLNSQPEFIPELRSWQQPRSKSFPPVLINITDAKHNGPGNPEEVAESIRRMGTEDGDVLICNCHFTQEAQQPEIFFPADISELFVLQNLQKSIFNQAEKMFDMSSVIPAALLENAQRTMEMPIKPRARAFMYNAKPDDLLKFLKWTTAGAKRR